MYVFYITEDVYEFPSQKRKIYTSQQPICVHSLAQHAVLKILLFYS